MRRRVKLILIRQNIIFVEVKKNKSKIHNISFKSEFNLLLLIHNLNIASNIYVLGFDRLANIVIKHCTSISNYHETVKVKTLTDKVIKKVYLTEKRAKFYLFSPFKNTLHLQLKLLENRWKKPFTVRSIRMC